MERDGNERLAEALWRLYARPERPQPWASGGNLPWDEPDFSQRMLQEHLDQGHGAASRVDVERAMQLDWFRAKLALRPGSRVLDMTCGPGLYAVVLAEQGCWVTGVDFGPASIEHARGLAAEANVADRCEFVLDDVRRVDVQGGTYDAALFLYGQLSVFEAAETEALLAKVARALRPGGRLVVELLDFERLDKQESTWWYTDNQGLWGDRPFLHLGERFWFPEQELALERFQILYLESGELVEIQLADQGYRVERMAAMMKAAGFRSVEVYPAWDGLALYDAAEWVVYVAEK